MKRRAFITLLGGAAAWPVAAGAQQSRKVPRIGVLLAGTPASFSLRARAFRDGLQDLGYVVNLDAAEPYNLPNLLQMAEARLLMAPEAHVRRGMMLPTIPLLLPEESLRNAL